MVISSKVENKAKKSSTYYCSEQNISWIHVDTQLLYDLKPSITFMP